MDLYKHFPDSELVFDDKFVECTPKFQEHDISTMDLLTTAPYELTQITGIPQEQIQRFVDTLSKETSSKYATDSRLPKAQFFTTGDSVIDAMLGGGIQLGQITEVFGVAAVGKSQFCMQLTRTVALPEEEGGLDANAVYISTEVALPTDRLSEINNRLDRVFCIACLDIDAQQHVLEIQLPLLIERENIKLVIIDSISHHMRVELLENNQLKNFNKNSLWINVVSQKLLDICTKYNVAIVVTNQIGELTEREILQSDYKVISTDYQIGWMSGWNHDPEDSIVSGGVPTLGLKWAQSVMVRILLEKHYQRGDEAYWEVKRKMKLVYPSHYPEQREVKVKITKTGMVSAPH